jgi:transaldolase
MTLIFHLVQAVAAANSKLFLISPFVGRLLDWSKKEFGKTYENTAEDPGVVFVTQLFNYYASHNIKTIIMGASFRNTNQIKYLAGCDRLTIAPALLEELQSSYGDVPLLLDREKAAELNVEDIDAS